MKKHAKVIVKEFKRSFGRFVAVCAIIALGVGFLIGIMDSTPDMKRTMDAFYDDAETYDCQVKAPYGLFADDLAAIKETAGVEAVVPFRSLDVEISTDRYKNAVGRVTGVDFYNQTMNLLTLESGRYPERVDECVVERSNDYLQAYREGDQIRIASDLDAFKTKTFTVTGVVSDTLYYARSEKERTAIGNGRLGAVVYVEDGVFDLTVTQGLKTMFGLKDGVTVGDPLYTDATVFVKGAKEAQVFSETYESLLGTCTDNLTQLGVERNAQKLTALKKFNEDYAWAEEAGLVTLMTDYDNVKWFSLNRTQNISYASMALNIDKVGDIAGIFPVFFLLVAALVALTTMTKMIEEDRTQIGTLKALGYSKGRILSKYLVYCGLATLIGCGIGVGCGFAALPTVLWQAYGMLYYLPTLLLKFDWLFSTVCTLVALCLTALVAVGACLNSMRTRPSELMLPKAPKAGKRILLERIPFIWNPLPFKIKSTLRNVFRYKKNLWMTVIGIAGCTALILTGFGIQDSVTTITERQFGAINNYALTLTVSGAPSEYGQDFKSFLDSHPNVLVKEESVNLIVGDEKQSLTVYSGDSSLSNFIRLQKSGAKTAYDFDDRAVILTENVARAFKIGVGDAIILKKTNGGQEEMTVTGITENYVDCACYVGAQVFTQRFGDRKPSLIFVQGDFTSVEEDAVTEQLLGFDAVNGVNFQSQTRVTYDNLLSTMKLITLVLVACAGCLSVIVLYNLTNINIDERKKELATLKVLGYSKWEVSGYVYRETFLLTVVGLLVGLGLGVLLHLFIIAKIESVTMMLGHRIYGLSYLYASLITLVFAALVDLMLAPKLSKIKMADSMKAND